MKEIRNEKGELHNLDGPAISYDCFESWWINGKRHRKDGPAYINGNIKVWWINGKRHREDGPAFINGRKEEWWLNGINKNEEWVKKYLKIKNNHLLLGVIVRDKWKIREIILRWRYDPKFKCVKNRLEKEYNNLYF